MDTVYLRHREELAGRLAHEFDIDRANVLEAITQVEAFHEAARPAPDELEALVRLELSWLVRRGLLTVPAARPGHHW
jgi:hypothetical protein